MNFFPFKTTDEYGLRSEISDKNIVGIVMVVMTERNKARLFDRIWVMMMIIWIYPYMDYTDDDVGDD